MKRNTFQKYGKAVELLNSYPRGSSTQGYPICPGVSFYLRTHPDHIPFPLPVHTPYPVNTPYKRQAREFLKMTEMNHNLRPPLNQPLKGSSILIVRCVKLGSET